MSQVCNLCNIDKPESDFYLTDGVKLFRRCKACISAQKVKKPKVAGWKLLPEETQTGIKTALQDRRQKIKDIATQFDVNYPNLCYWIRSGHI